jgi:hypothetical protein
MVTNNIMVNAAALSSNFDISALTANDWTMVIMKAVIAKVLNHASNCDGLQQAV